MNICADCGQPTNRGITASKTDRARNRIYDTVKRRAKGMRQISR